MTLHQLQCQRLSSHTFTCSHVESQKQQEHLHKSSSSPEELVAVPLGHLRAELGCLGVVPAQWDRIVVDGASALLAGAVVDADCALWCGPM